jgi:hypothetical protein
LFLHFRYVEFWEEGWEREGQVALIVGTTAEQNQQINDAARTFEIFAFYLQFFSSSKSCI